jgi:hypothetical protein
MNLGRTLALDQEAVTRNNVLYELLGVKSDATTSEIKAAWRKSVFAEHPDSGGDKAAFQHLGLSYEVWRTAIKIGMVLATPLRHPAVTNRSKQWRTVAKANSNVCNDFRSRGNKNKRGAGDGNRTRVLSLGS